MRLHTIKEFDPDYRNHFDDKDIVGYDLYAGADKVGSVDDLLVDDTGKIRYLVINTGVWILGKKLLLPIGRARIDYTGHRIAVDEYDSDSS
ncbi:MAG: PRC-barrel domain-containing protein [Nostoc sp.]|uniref:PRC-barrel domain-containing protein n=1 Tax=Nostoc sp. TaxID=1180 RepID=UPI002FF7625B